MMIYGFYFYIILFPIFRILDLKQEIFSDKNCGISAEKSFSEKARSRGTEYELATAFRYW